MSMGPSSFTVVIKCSFFTFAYEPILYLSFEFPFALTCKRNVISIQQRQMSKLLKVIRNAFITTIKMSVEFALANTDGNRKLRQ